MTFDRDNARALIAEVATLPQETEWVRRGGQSVHVMQLVRELADALEAALSAVPVEGEVEWEYAHEYTDEGGGKHRRKVSASEYAERKPDGHRADGSPYWNYTQKRRRKAGPWEVAP